MIGLYSGTVQIRFFRSSPPRPHYKENMALNRSLKITTTEMHTGGEPLRVVEHGTPAITGTTLLDKRRYVKQHLDDLRKFLVFEPRGHHDMYGVYIVEPDHPEADFGVLFFHNEGYSTMCGHAVIALGRYAVDKGLIGRAPTAPETQVNIQCPCGLVKTFVEYNNGKTGAVRFHSVPAFAFALDVEVNVPGYGTIKVDVGYGGAFYALAHAQSVGVDVRTSHTKDLIEAASAISDAVRKKVVLSHPDSPDLAFLYGTILTDGNDTFSETPTANVCVFAANEVDRSPTGSGVTARVAVQVRRGLLGLHQARVFESGANLSRFTGKAIATTSCGDLDAVIVEVTGQGHYTGSNTFTLEEDDDLKGGFWLR